MLCARLTKAALARRSRAAGSMALGLRSWLLGMLEAEPPFGLLAFPSLSQGCSQRSPSKGHLLFFVGKLEVNAGEERRGGMLIRYPPLICRFRQFYAKQLTLTSRSYVSDTITTRAYFRKVCLLIHKLNSNHNLPLSEWREGSDQVTCRLSSVQHRSETL